MIYSQLPKSKGGKRTEKAYCSDSPDVSSRWGNIIKSLSECD